MEIELKEITVRDLAEGFEEKPAEGGVIGYGGRLDIRPPYQREFIYEPKQRDAVINTIQNNFPLNVMYWAVREDEDFEVIDGQQRTISVCQYVIGDFSFNSLYFHNLPDDKKEQILNYKLMVYLCSGTDSERLDWFRTINIAGAELYEQELRNAVYSGPWVTNAKTYFSKTGCPAYEIGSKYLKGSPIRQDYLETAIEWIAEGTKIEDYMSIHQHEPNANALWIYFQAVISWVKATFPRYRKEMKGIDWGIFYNQFHGDVFDTDELEREIATLMMDEDVTKKAGIYRYVLTRDEKYLNIRAFSDNQKREAYERQEGICVKCGEHFELDEMEADHATPWREGGRTSAENCQLLCKDDNRRKSGK